MGVVIVPNIATGFASRASSELGGVTTRRFLILNDDLVVGDIGLVLGDTILLMGENGVEVGYIRDVNWVNWLVVRGHWLFVVSGVLRLIMVNWVHWLAVRDHWLFVVSGDFWLVVRDHWLVVRGHWLIIISGNLWLVIVDHWLVVISGDLWFIIVGWDLWLVVRDRWLVVSGVHWPVVSVHWLFIVSGDHWLELIDFGLVVWLDEIVDLGRVGVIVLGINRVLVIGAVWLVAIGEIFNNWMMVYLGRLVDFGVARNLGVPFIVLNISWEVGLIGVLNLLIVGLIGVVQLLVGVVRLIGLVRLVRVLFDEVCNRLFSGRFSRPSGPTRLWLGLIGEVWLLKVRLLLMILGIPV